MRKRTIEIFKNPVIVTTASGMSPIVETMIMIGMRLVVVSPICRKPHHAHAKAFADPDQFALSDAAAHSP